MKYGRLCTGATGVTTVADLFKTMGDTDADDGVNAILGPDAEMWLDTMFSTLKSQWQAEGEWFVQIPLGVKIGAEFIGDKTKMAEVSDLGNYVNPK